MKKYIVYKHMINNKPYIGYTSLTIEERLNKHILNANSGIETHFYRAIRKYGVKSITSEILFETDEKKEALNKEMELIKEYESLKNGYNMTEGGDGGDITSNFSKERWEEYINKLSNRSTGDKNPNHSGYSDEELINEGVKLAKDNDNVFYYNLWQEHAKKNNLPQSFSKNRFKGSFKYFKELIEEEMGIKLKGYEKTEEHKLKLAKSIEGRKWYNDGKNNYQLLPTNKKVKKLKEGRI